jgi:predicted nucleotidyltransferase
MSEVTQLITTLKRQLKQQGKTYRDVALALDLSEASVKRLFASESFALEDAGGVAAAEGQVRRAA